MPDKTNPLRLSQIKISGFKSFSQPVQLVFPTNRIGVVGPNGCGKSNVIDAIRWVLGESSASNLRSDTIANVIFNGSEEQAAANRASVEMTFEGDLSKLGAKFAGQKHIRISRRVEREKESRYRINDSDCRRKDIAALFSGMGITGHADYAIISQGSVHNIVESRPEHIRLLMEEAAGITGYLQKRKETQAHIKATRANLQQVSQLLRESSRRMQELQQQAEDAKLSNQLRQQLEELKQQQMILEYREISKKQLSKEDELNDILQRLNTSKDEAARLTQQQGQAEEKLAALRSKLQQLETQRTQLAQSLGGKESELSYAKQQQDAHQQRQTELEQQQQQDQQESEDEQQLQQAQQALTALQQQAAQQASSQQDDQQLLQLEEQLSQLDQQWQDSIQTTAQAKAKHRGLQQDAQNLQTQLNDKQRQLTTGESLAANQQLTKQLEKLRQQQQKIQQQLQTNQQQTDQQLAQQAAIEQQLQKMDAEHQQLDKKLLTANLEMEHLEVRLPDKGLLRQVLEKLRLTDSQAWSKQLQVTAGWETAIERVAQQLLMAYQTNDLPQAMQQLASESPVSLGLMSQQTSKQKPVAFNGQPPLAQFIKRGAVPSFLYHVYPCTDLKQALEWRSALQDYQSLVTPEGQWLGNNWVSLDPSIKQGGVLQKQQRYAVLKKERDKTNQALAQLAKELTQMKQQKQAAVKTLQESQQQGKQLESQLKQLENTLWQTEQQLAQQQREDAEQQTHLQQIQQLQQQLEELQPLVQQASQASVDLDKQHQQLEAQRQQVHTSLQQARKTQHQQRAIQQQQQQQQAQLGQQVTELEKSLQDKQRRKQSYLANHENLKKQVQQAQQKVAQAEQQVQQLQTQQQQLNTQHQQLAEQLRQDEAGLEKIRRQRNQQEQAAALAERDMNEVQRAGDQLQLQLSDLKTRNEEIQRQASQLTANINLPEIKVKLNEMQRRYDRLGAVNQLALRDYEVEKQRGDDMRQQQEEVKQALKDLEDTIKRIDKTSRKRFEETLKRVNVQFGQLFHKLTGGGKAYLDEDTVDNKGIRIMARPPGRRNSSISLLSGGEKSLTALALVMAIFQLNPAPFCLMDEADAMLDDENVVRLNRLLTEMMEETQFIVVTHNKITMQSCRHLIGITMSEPGVSRTVSVDVERAVEMARVG